MTKANKTIIKDKILDLREKIQKQSRDLHKQIEQKTKRFENLLDNSLFLDSLSLVHILNKRKMLKLQ